MSSKPTLSWYTPGFLRQKMPQESADGMPSLFFHGYHAAKSIVAPRLRSSGMALKKDMLKSPMRTSTSCSTQPP